MDLIFLLVLPALLWTQSWHLLGLYASPRTLGITAAAVAIALLAVVIFQDKIPITPIYPSPGTPAGGFLDLTTSLSAFILLWAVYAVVVAGVYLWGLDARSLGFYSLFLCLMSILFAVYLFLGGELLGGDLEINTVSWLLGAAAALLAILSATLSLYLTRLPYGEPEPPFSAMRRLTGYFYLASSMAVAVLGGLLLLGIDPAL